MQAGQAFLRGVGGLQAVLLAALGAVPGLPGVVDPPDVVGAWGEGTGVNAHRSECSQERMLTACPRSAPTHSPPS